MAKKFINKWAGLTSPAGQRAALRAFFAYNPKNGLKMRFLRTILMLLIIGGGINARTDPQLEQLFQQGNEAYQSENYSEAIRIYEDIVRRGYESGELYFNLGNAYYRIGNIGQTILNYERAARRLPNDPNVAFNLKLANLSVKDKIDMPPVFFLFRWYQGCVNLLSARGWAFLFSILLLVSVVGFAILLNIDFHRLRGFFKSTCIIIAILSLLAMGFLIQKYQIETADDQGIVVSGTVSSLAAPQTGSTELFIVHEGTKVRILDADGEWLKIELIDGKQGWVTSADIARI